MKKKAIIAYKRGYKYQLVEDYRVQTDIVLGEDKKDIVTKYITLKNDGTLIIRNGMAWDGPSGPTIDTKNFMRGSLVHDALYELLRSGKLDVGYREQADIELKKICLEDGMSKLRVWYVFKSVRGFAKGAALPENKKEVLTAP